MQRSLIIVLSLMIRVTGAGCVEPIRKFMDHFQNLSMQSVGLVDVLRPFVGALMCPLRSHLGVCDIY